VFGTFRALEELEASATEDELAAEMAAAKTTKVAAFTRKRPSRKPFPSTFPENGLLRRDRHASPAVAARASPSSARTSPRCRR
jgi:hypothetical protein